MWHVSTRSGVTTLPTAIHLFLTCYDGHLRSTQESKHLSITCRYYPAKHQLMRGFSSAGLSGRHRAAGSVVTA